MSAPEVGGLYRGQQRIVGAAGQRNGLVFLDERINGEHRTENLVQGNRGGWVDVNDQSRREVCATAQAGPVGNLTVADNVAFGRCCWRSWTAPCVAACVKSTVPAERLPTAAIAGTTARDSSCIG